MGGETRDTDADWRHLGDTDPFWGVLAAPAFRRDALDEQALEAFYASGRADVDRFVATIHRHTGRPPPFRRALDIGCGAGRLSEAMRDHAEAVTGYDISPGMLAAAQARSGSVAYTAILPDGAFDWINAYIVFQHIPPARGYALLDEVLDRLAPNGVVSLHFTVSRHDRLTGGTARTRSWPWVRRAAALIGVGSRGADEPLGAVSMYDYDLNVLFARFRRHGLHDLALSFVDHDGHYGYLFVGAKAS